MSEKENKRPPPSKKPRLSLSLNRFKKASNSELQELSKPKMPKNTSTSTRWAMKNLTDWFNHYNAANQENQCPEEVLLPSCSAETLNKWLCVYAVETRSHTGEAYPPSTVYSLLCGILRYMKSENPMYPNFLEKSNPVFAEFTTTIDNLFKNLRSSGIGATKHTESISPEEEELLWTSKVLNVDTPLGLLRAVFFYNGKCFCLRGGQEQRELKISQLERLHDPERYLYRENSSKNRKGGLKELRLEHKSVVIVANPDVGVRCHVYLLDLYISKLPPEAVAKDLFYCRPLQFAPVDKPWFIPVPIGRNLLAKMMSTMCEEAGIASAKTNHSLRVAGTSAMFDAGVPERIIQGRTGHRSLEALRMYERVTNQQEIQVSKVLSRSIVKFNDDHSSSSNTSKTESQFSDQKNKKFASDQNAKVLSPIPPTMQPLPTAQYNNCTINMYQTPPCFPPWMDLPPPSFTPTSSYCDDYMYVPPPTSSSDI